MQISCRDGQFAKKLSWTTKCKMSKKMIRNDVVDLLNRLDLVDKISDEKHTKIYSKHRKNCKKCKKYKHAKNAKKDFEQGSSFTISQN